MLKVLFITSVSHTPSQRNMNHFQRVHFLSRGAHLTILGGKGADFSASASESATIIRSPVSGKAGILLWGIWMALKGKSKRFDIVLTEPSILAVLGILFKVLSRCKWVVDVWDIPIRCYLEQSRIVQFRCSMVREILRELFKWADLFIVSIVPAYDLKEFCIPTEKMVLLRNAIWHDERSEIPCEESSRKTLDLLCMRSVHTLDMGMDTLAEAFRILRNEMSEVTLTIIGEIPQEVMPQLQGLEKVQGVRLMGYVPRDRLGILMKEAAVHVIPYKDVPDLAQIYPIKALEYMQSGKPVVAADIMGLRAMIQHEETGLLFRPGDGVDLARQIRRVLQEEALAGRVAERAREAVRQYDCVSKNRLIMQRLGDLAQGA